MKQALFTITLLCSRTLMADCPEGVYTTTEADKQFLTETVAVVRTALPPTPDGWRLEDRNPKVYVPPRSYCKGAENQPLIEGYSVKYVWVAGQKDLTQKLTEIQKKINAVNGVPMAAEQLKQMTELQIKDRDLRYAARKAEKPEADRMKAEASCVFQAGRSHANRVSKRQETATRCARSRKERVAGQHAHRSGLVRSGERHGSRYQRNQPSACSIRRHTHKSERYPDRACLRWPVGTGQWRWIESKLPARSQYAEGLRRHHPSEGRSETSGGSAVQTGRSRVERLGE